MNIAFFNGHYMPLDEVRISPLDRGFLFGEGIYEVIPYYDSHPIAWELHLERLWQGLAALDIQPEFTSQQLGKWCHELVHKNGAANQAVYVHVTRGVEANRFHGWDNSGETTLFMMSNSIPEVLEPQLNTATLLEVSAEPDRRWRNCHIKSTSLLGNVMHFQKARDAGHQEVLLLDAENYVAEASTSNVFIVRDQRVITPPLGTGLLPGVTRNLMLSILRQHSEFDVLERNITLDEVLDADEVWLTSSSRGVAPVVKVGEHVISTGKAGNVWLAAALLYYQHKFDY